MPDLTTKEMEAILIAHEVAELAFNIEATMATVAPDPHWELCFAGLAVDGWDAVYEMYRRVLIPLPGFAPAAQRRVHAVADNTLIREAHITFENARGERVTGVYCVILEFDPDLKKIKGERMYLDPLFAEGMIQALGEDFAQLPGVSRITDIAPRVDVHDAYAEAAALGIPIPDRP